MFGLIHRGELPRVVENEFEHLALRLKHLWLVEHNEDGTHRTDLTGGVSEDHVHDASDVTTGIFNVLRIPDLDAAKITTGVFDKARQNTATAYKDEANTFTLLQTMNAGVSTGFITFPAVQVPQANVNTLDDYEEGLWTPAITSSGGGAATYSVQSGRYIKIGKQVSFSGRITLATKGTLAAGDVSIVNLPFTSDTTANTFGILNIIYQTGMSTAIVSMTGLISDNSSSATLRMRTGAIVSDVAVTVASIGATLDIVFGGHYYTGS